MLEYKTELSLLVLLSIPDFLKNFVIGTGLHSAVSGVCASRKLYSAPRRSFGGACHAPDCAAARLSGVTKI